MKLRNRKREGGKMSLERGEKGKKRKRIQREIRDEKRGQNSTKDGHSAHGKREYERTIKEDQR